MFQSLGKHPVSVDTDGHMEAKGDSGVLQSKLKWTCAKVSSVRTVSKLWEKQMPLLLHLISLCHIPCCCHRDTGKGEVDLGTTVWKEPRLCNRLFSPDGKGRPQ